MHFSRRTHTQRLWHILKPLGQQARRLSLNFAKYSRRHSEEFNIIMQKNWILLRGFFVRQRTLGLRNGMPPIKFTLSEAAGHGAFVAVALSYSEKDVLNLRMYACSGIVLNILFQYYRSVPLWIPLRWNVLFLAINTSMIFVSLRENFVAEYIPKDHLPLYEGVFKGQGLSKVDFQRLMEKGVRMRVEKGHNLFAKGGERKTFYMVQHGKLHVLQEGGLIATVAEGQVVGETRFFEWKQRFWAAKQRMEVVTAASTLVSGALAVGGMGDSAGGGSDTNSAATAQAGPVGKSDVVAVTPCVLYAWSFVDLEELLAAEPRIAIVVERLISNDLNKKILQSNKTSSKYRYVLQGALLGGDRGIFKANRQALQQYRLQNNISDDEHAEMLRELGWSVERFDTAGLAPVPVPYTVPVMAARPVDGAEKQQAALTRQL